MFEHKKCAEIQKKKNRQELQEINELEASQKPKINKLSKIIVEELRNKDTIPGLESRLSSRTYINQTFQRRKTQYELETTSELKFKPEILKASERNRNFKAIYDDTLRRQNVKSQLESNLKTKEKL